MSHGAQANANISANVAQVAEFPSGEIDDGNIRQWLQAMLQSQEPMSLVRLRTGANKCGTIWEVDATPFGQRQSPRLRFHIYIDIKHIDVVAVKYDQEDLSSSEAGAATVE